MAEKELLAYLVAHNLIRCVMAQAVACYSVELERISFKGSLDALRQHSAAMAQARNSKLRRMLWEDLLRNLARDLVPLRHNRREPRPSNAGQQLIRCSINPAAALSKSPTAVVIGKADPAIIEALTKGYSGQSSLLTRLFCRCGCRFHSTQGRAPPPPKMAWPLLWLNRREVSDRVAIQDLSRFHHRTQFVCEVTPFLFGEPGGEDFPHCGNLRMVRRVKERVPRDRNGLAHVDMQLKVCVHEARVLKKRDQIAFGKICERAGANIRRC